MRAILRSVLLAVLACVVFTLAGVVMMMMPVTPQGRALRQFNVLSSYRNAPDDPAAAAAFDEWLRLSHRASLVEATVLPLISGAAVLAASQVAGALALRELLAIIGGFAMFEAGRRGVDALWLSGVVVFGASLWLGGQWLNRARRTGN